MCKGYEDIFLKLFRERASTSILKRRLIFLMFFLYETILYVKDIFLLKTKRLMEIMKYGRKK